MKLLDYIRGLRNGKEAHRLEKESMKDSFLADAMDGYQQVKGTHERNIEALRKQIVLRTAKRKNRYAITWSIAACLLIGFGISSYFLFFDQEATEKVFVAKQTIIPKESAPIAPSEKEKVLPKAAQDTAHTDLIMKGIGNRIVAKAQKRSEPEAILLEELSVPDTTKRSLHSALAGRMTKSMSTTFNSDWIKGKVTDEKGEPIVGAGIHFKGTEVGAVTDLNGLFSLKKLNGKNELTAQYIGYKPMNIQIDTTQTVLITMIQNNESLSESMVVGRRVPKTTVAKSKRLRMPQPTIGKRKYNNYLEQNLLRPIDKQCKEVKGEVTLTFIVDAHGTPQQVTIIKSLCPSADHEAIRLLREGPKWTIGKLPVTIKIRF